MALREHIDRALRVGAARLDGDGTRLFGGHCSWSRRSVWLRHHAALPSTRPICQLGANGCWSDNRSPRNRQGARDARL